MGVENGPTTTILSRQALVRSRIQRYIAGVFGAGLVLGIGCWKACDTINPCENYVFEQETSTDGKKQLLVFTRDCGATTRVGYHVSLMDTGETLQRTDAGNLLRVEIPRGKRPPRAEWIAKTVLVTYPAKSEVYKKNTSLDGIVVEYRALDSR
jgi:hypothetical protein